MNRKRSLVDGPSWAVTLLLVVCSVLSLTAAQDDYDDIRIRQLNDPVTLNCSSDSLQSQKNHINESSPIGWMLPLPSLLMINESTDKYLLHTDKWTLTIFNTSVSDLGQYHCMFYNESYDPQYYLIKVGLNVRGPYFDVLWDKYEIPTIIGICALFGFLLLALAVILIYHFRYIPPPGETQQLIVPSEVSAFGYVKTAEVDTKLNDEDVSEPRYEVMGYDNKGMDPDEMTGGSSGVSSATEKEDAPEYATVTKSKEAENEMMTSRATDHDDDDESTTVL